MVSFEGWLASIDQLPTALGCHVGLNSWAIVIGMFLRKDNANSSPKVIFFRVAKQ